MKRIIPSIACVAATLLLRVSAPAQTIAIDQNNPHQTIDGVGFCHEGDRENGDTYIIDEKIQQMLDNNMSLFRDMFPNRTFEPSKNSFNYTDTRVTNCWQRLKTMQDRGIVTILGIWDVPDWLVSNPTAGGGRRINNMDDFANMIYQFVKYGHDHYGLTINYIDVNETAESGVNIYLTSQEYSSFIQKCSALFAGAGLSTKVNQGSVLLWDIAYDQDIYNSTKTLPGAGHPSWHSYRGGSLTGSQREDISLWQGWGNWAQTLDRNLWATETDYDAFYYNNPDRYTWTGCEEMAEMYYRNYYVARCATSAGWYWHETADEDAYMSSAIHQAYMQNFEIGGQILDTTQPDQYIRVIGYKHVAHNKFVIQALNEYSSDRTVTFTGVPTNVVLSMTRTSQAGDKLTPIGSVTASGNSVTVTLKAYSFTTFSGALGSGSGTQTGNLALNRPVTVSSVEPNTTYSGANAVDGNLSTRWSSAYADNQWLTIDLGSSQAFTEVDLNWEAAYASHYQVQVSNDNTTWTTLRDVTNNTATTNTLTGLAATGRYVRINCLTRATQWGFSLFEVGVYNTSQVVAIKANVNGMYVCADNAGASPLIANRTTAQAWELFDEINLGNGQVAFRAHANGMYVSAENAGANPLIADEPHALGWETFQLVPVSGGVALKSLANGMYVSAENAGANPLIADEPHALLWETFTIIPQ